MNINTNIRIESNCAKCCPRRLRFLMCCCYVPDEEEEIRRVAAIAIETQKEVHKATSERKDHHRHRKEPLEKSPNQR